MRPGIALVFVAVVAGSAAAAPTTLASLREDVDGDGVADVIELTSDGRLVIGTRPVTELQLAPAFDRARLEISRAKTGVLIVADVGTTSGEHAIIVGREARRWIELARVPVGGVGLDREYAYEIDATPLGVYHYQVRGDIKRCDGKPTYLFPQGFDRDWREFRKVLPPPMIDASAPQLAARVDTEAAHEPLLYKAHAASHVRSATDAGALTIPAELDDGRPDTAWIEGLGSDGRGQFFTFEARAAGAKAHQIRIVATASATPAVKGASLKGANRVRELGIATAAGTWRVELPDAEKQGPGRAFVVDLPQAISGCVTVVILSTYGPPSGQTAIAELGVYAEGERGGSGDVLLAGLVADGGAGAMNAAAALAKRGGPGAVAISAELQKRKHVPARRRLLAALVQIKDPAAVPALVGAAESGTVRDQDLIDLIDALARNGQVQALRDLAARKQLPIDARVAAASRIDPVAGFEQLTDLAGTAPRQVRRQVIEQLAQAPLAELLPFAQYAMKPGRAGDVWRAITRHARTHPEARPAIVAAMREQLVAATDYERRYRLIDGIATYGDAEALRALDTFLRALPAGPRTSALRQVAIEGISSAPRPEAIDLVIAFARDTDPGVRLAALSALAAAETDGGGPWHAPDGPDSIDRVLINGLATDTWPEIRRRAATALGARCTRPGPATALVQAVTGDRNLDVRGDALTALVQCKASGVGALLARTWDDGKAPIELRKRAVDLVILLEDRQLAATLIRKLAAWRADAIESRASLELAQSAAGVLGRLNPPGAQDALIAALDDTAFPEIVSSAALALGTLGPACSQVAKARLTAIARQDDRSSTAARHAARLCGR